MTYKDCKYEITDKTPVGKALTFSTKQAITSQKKRFAGLIALILAYAALEGAFVFANNRLFSALKGLGGSWAEIAAPLSLVIGLCVFQYLSLALWEMVRSVMEARYARHVLTRILSHMAEVDQSVLDQADSGELVSRTIEDSKIATRKFIRPVSESAYIVTDLLAKFAVLFTIAWEPALIVLAIKSFLVAFGYLSTKRLEKTSAAARGESSKLWSAIFEAFKNVKFLKVNNLQTRYQREVNERADSYQEGEYATQRFAAYLASIQRLFFVISWTACIATALAYNVEGLLSLASVITFVLTTAWMRGQFIRVFECAQLIREIRVSFARLSELMKFKTTVLSRKTLDVSRPDLLFDKVTFGYDQKNLLLENATFAFPYGKTYAIVGKTGSGKSTTLDILTGTYPVVGGRVMFGGMPLNEDTVWSVRNAVSIAYQLPFLINGTIERNVKLLNKTIDEKRLNEILRITHVDRIVAHLPKGLQSEVGDAGVQLSGGERKRVQLAQTLAKDAEVYMFDELTASLDQHTARTVMTEIKSHLKGKTVIFIEHRLSMVADVDTIYEVQDKTLRTVSHDAIKDR